MAEREMFHLKVPVDASKVKNFKPDRAIKVIAYESGGTTMEETVRLDNGGKGNASFRFPHKPGSLTVALGPENVSAEDLKHMQTITAYVSVPQWKQERSLTIPVVAISTYYWEWWWRWCVTYTVTGRVICPDGSPVVGATVCAYDEDAWWWWLSSEQVGCGTTAVDGSFEIQFTRCCGWWPWWWFEEREWQVDPYLVQRITAAVKAHSKIATLPRAVPNPSLAVFDQLLTTARAPHSGRASLAAARSISGASTKFDPSVLEAVRGKLLEILPKEFPYPIWPWYPWWPWWSCNANLIFQVTQNCGGQVNTIVNETFADTRWDIPTNLNVTLSANDQACCTYTCVGQDCPSGNCLVPSDICDINVGSVGGNVGNSAPAADVGLAYPGTQDRPFAGTVDFYGQFGDLVADLDYYEFNYSTTSSTGPWTPLPLGALETFVRQVLVTLPGPIFTWNPIVFSPNQISDGTTTHNVYETISHYEANNGPQVWDSITHDLLLPLNSANVLPNGVYYLQLVGWKRTGYTGNLSDPQTLPVCDPDKQDPKVENYWVVALDNQAPGDTDPSGQPCGIHICTDQPISDLISVAIQHHDGSTTPIEGCGVVCIVATDKLVVDFAAYDPDAFLESYNLQLFYSTDLSVPLLSLGTAIASPLAPAWAPAPPTGPNPPHNALVGPDYASALAQGAASPVWNGGSMRLVVSATDAFPTLPCAYLLQLNVNKRPIVNCDEVDYVQQNVSFQSFTVQACPSPS